MNKHKSLSAIWNGETIGCATVIYFILIFMTPDSCNAKDSPKSLKEMCMMKPLIRECRGSVLKRGLPKYVDLDTLLDEYLNAEIYRFPSLGRFNPRDKFPANLNIHNNLRLLTYLARLMQIDLMAQYGREINAPIMDEYSSRSNAKDNLAKKPQ